MPRPEGYRKALRLMRLAEKFGLPLLTFIDTPGAYPGIDAEERGQSEAIGHNLQEMAGLRVPIIVTVIGEGGSGGALAIGERRRYRADAAIRDLFSHFAGGLCLDPVEKRRKGERRCGNPGDHRTTAEVAGFGRQGGQRTSRRRAPGARTDGPESAQGDWRVAQAP